MTEVASHGRSKKTEHKSGDESDRKESLSTFLKNRHKERERGFLTPKDRELLYSNIGDTDTTRTQRYRMRKRLQNGVKDFELVSNCFDEVDRKKVFNDILEEERGYNYLVHMGALIYEAIQQSSYDSEDYISETIGVAEGTEDIEHVLVNIQRPSKEEIQQRPK